MIFPEELCIKFGLSQLWTDLASCCEYPESFLKQKIEASKKWLPTRRHVGTHPESLERSRVNAPNETGPHESQAQNISKIW